MAKQKTYSISDTAMFVVKVTGRNREKLAFLEKEMAREQVCKNVLDIRNSDIIAEIVDIAYWVKKKKINIQRG